MNSTSKNESRSQFLLDSDKFDFKGFMTVLRVLTKFWDFLNDPTSPMTLHDVMTDDLAGYNLHNLDILAPTQ